MTHTTPDPMDTITKAWAEYARLCKRLDEDVIAEMEDCASEIEDACALMLAEITTAQNYVDAKT